MLARLFSRLRVSSCSLPVATGTWPLGLAFLAGRLKRILLSSLKRSSSTV
jgi:hypothetical protein